MLKLALVFVILISGVKCGYYFVILPNVIRFNHSETVSVSVFELENAHVKIWLKHGKKLFSHKTVVVPNEEKPVLTTVKVTENDLFDTVVKDKPRNVEVCSEYDGIRQCREVILNYQTGYLIVQTDKPIYTPLNKVTVRTVALDESLRAVDGWQVGMDIISPKGIPMARKTINRSPCGFFQNVFTLPPYPDFGIWTARSFYRGQFETESRALFEVQEYVLPTFDVTIDVDIPYILSDTAEIKITVRAMYVYRKPVEGNARLTLSLQNESGDIEFLSSVNRKTLGYDGKSNKGSEKEFIIKLDTIMHSQNLSGKAFPDRSRLRIDAIVYEHATGKEEAASHDGTMFVVEPYIFRFTRSKLIFKPGWEYNLKVDMLYANKQPAAGENIEVRMYKHDKLHTNINATTDDQGKVSLLFQTVANDKTLTFKAVTRDNRHASEEFVVNGYADDHQIIAEHIIKDKTMTLRAYANMKFSGSTGLLFMVVTRGKVVLTKFKETSNQVSVVLPEEIQELISPSARLLVFYVDKNTGKLVADSDKFDVAQKCRDKGLTLKTQKMQVLPGDVDRLTVEGDPKMWIGLNIMDKALLILNNKNVLRKSKMFRALESHDLGCGAGSGRNAADVFKQTGLTVLTNAYRPEGDLQRTSVGCEGSKRRKRDTGECYYAANIRCCEKGYEFAKNILHEAESPEQLDPYTKCYAKARTLVKEIPMRCVMAFLTSCRTELEILISDKTGIVSKSFADESDYYDYDIARLADAGFKFRTRSNFRESWLFEVKQLDSSGQFQTNLNYPHSITEWMIQAIGITSSKGLCIADPVNVTAFRDFFVQLDLPYKTTRLEQFDVKATIFSYGQPTSPNRTANIYLEGVQHLCYNSVPGTPSPRIQISLPPNSAHTVRFPVIPLKKGMFSVKVSAFVMDLGIPIADVVEKQLYVENEGIEENLSIQVCLDPSNQMEDCKNDASVSSYDPDQRIEPERMYSVDLTLPQNSIPGTGSATAYIQSNLMDNVVRIVIEGVDDLLRAPTGCGEQTLSKFAPTVYAMMYLKETYQVTKEIEILGSRHIREGIAKETSTFRKFDGSFVFYKSSWSISDTWLTAFVAKVFCQARRIVDNAGIVRQDIASSINWLKTKIKNNGQFINDNPYKSYNAGRVKSEDPLTAFVLITLLECDIRDKALNESISKAMHFLENLEKSVLKKNPHLLAISTYALAMANSKKKWEFKDLLHQIEKKNGNDSYWGTPGSNVANAHCVETTAYALLAMMEFDDWKISTNNIVRWLTSQRNSNGAFRSTQDTVVALQALSTYNVKSYSPDVDLVVEVLGWEKDQLKITPEKKGVQQIAKKLPVENKGNRLNVLVTGTGTARMIIDLRYNRPATEEEDCPFEISPIDVDSVKSFPIDVNLAKESICDVCGYCEKEPAHSDYDIFDPPEENLEMENNFRRRKRGAAVRVKDICIKFSVRSKTEKEFGMSIVNFGLETGVEVVKDDLDKLLDETENIERYEMPSNGKGFVIFYLQEITSEETKFIFRLKDGFEGDTRSRHPSSVKVYDYYNPDQSCLEFYGTGQHQAQELHYTCDKQQLQCKCSLSICAQPVEEKLLRLYNERKYPVLKLYRYTCNPEKADYAMLVHIESTDTDEKKRQRTAVGRVLESLHQGIEQLEVDDEVDFFWSEICDELNIEKDGEYFIIGKDGNIFKTDEGKGYKYPLMGTTLVIKTGQEKPLSVIMDRYQKLLKKRNGCSS